MQIKIISKNKTNKYIFFLIFLGPIRIDLPTYFNKGKSGWHGSNFENWLMIFDISPFCRNFFIFVILLENIFFKCYTFYGFLLLKLFCILFFPKLYIFIIFENVFFLIIFKVVLKLFENLYIYFFYFWKLFHIFYNFFKIVLFYFLIFFLNW